MSDSTADPDQDEPTDELARWEPPVPSVTANAALLLAFAVLTAANLYWAFRGAQQTAWKWSNVKDGVRRGWLA